MWRYKLVRLELPRVEPSEIATCEGRLNELGGEGWEIVAVIERGESLCAFLKMPYEVGTF
jgi:hypothetical protein